MFGINIDTHQKVLLIWVKGCILLLSKDFAFKVAIINFTLF